MKTPIIVDEQGDLAFFRTVEAVQTYLEADDVKARRYSAYDSEGQRLLLTTRTEDRPVFFGLFRVPVETVVVQAESRDPQHADAVRALLAEFIRKTNSSAAEPDDATPLADLLDRALAKAGFTN